MLYTEDKGQHTSDQIIIGTSENYANGVKITPAAAGADVAVAAVGDDTNINLDLTPKGTGQVVFKGILLELPQDTITAGTTQTQAGATAITGQTARVTTVGTAGDGVKLPASAAGMEVLVINHGANAMRVYGTGADQIDDITNTTGVLQMPNSLVIYSCATAGNWYSEGLATGYGGAGLQTLSFFGGVTAGTTQTQAGATALTSMINRVATVANSGDGVRLPTSAVGLAVLVLNRGAQPMQVYGASTDTINGIVTTTGISQGVNTAALYTCMVAGNWEVPLSSLVTSTPVTIGANGAINPHIQHTYVITKAGVAAMTLAAPTTGTDDGNEMTITSSTAFAHTITATGLLQTGSAAVNVATFNAQAGASLTLMAYAAKWIVLNANGVSFS
jgi:hypothetical protein